MDVPSSVIPRWLVTAIGLLLIVWLAILSYDRFLQSGLDLNNLTHWQNPKSTNNTITVSAEGKVTATPDVALISLSVETRGATVAQVQADNTKKMNDITDFVKQSGVADKDVTTSQYNLYPNYTYDPRTGKQTQNGYTLTQTLTVKIRKLDSAGTILAGAIDRGANQVGQLSFTIDDPEALMQQARLQAVAKARAKAETLAQAAGAKLGKLASFSESPSNVPVPIFYGRAEAVGMGGAAPTPAPNVQPGSQDITDTVNLSFEIE